ncbi:MAG TPA: ArsR family transcriptional regulator [Candidatus Nitrosotenuis sp.]|nr:ArsR family transcriptional regulator [Candidatus Nitrosotenuis sp.]
MQASTAPLEEVFTDSGCSKIFDIIGVSKTASEISNEAKMPLTTVYRKLKILKKLGFLETSGEIRDGTKLRFFRRGKMYTYYHDNPKIAKIVDIISKNPGIRFNELQQKTSFSSGALSTYMYDLVNAKNILAKRTTRRTWFFPHDIDPAEIDVIINLRKETNRKIIYFLLSSPSKFKEICKISEKSPSTTSFVLKQLVDAELIRRVGEDGGFEITDKEKIWQVLQKTKIIDENIQQFAGLFSN